MKKILIGAERSCGTIEEGKRKIEYDNIKLYLANYRQGDGKGFSIGKNFEAVKIKTEDFAEVAGISVKEFLTNFEKKYMFCKVRVLGEMNNYDRLEVEEVKFTTKKCFELWRELRAQEEEKKLEQLTEDDEDDILADMADFEIDTEIGEVS